MLRKQIDSEANVLLGLKASVLEDRLPEGGAEAIDKLDIEYKSENEAEIALYTLIGLLNALGDRESFNLAFTIQKLHRL